jgi:hypothetical protein
MGNDDRPKTEIRFGDHTKIDGDVVAGNKLETGDIRAEKDATVNVAGGDIQYFKVEKGGMVVIQPGGAQPELRGLQQTPNALLIDDLLFYSVNCDSQIDQLEETLAQHGSQPCCMLACMLHGDINQAQDMFLKRVQVELLPQILDLDLERTPLGVYHLPWPGQVQKLADLPRLLNKNLAGEVLEDRDGTKEKISQRLAAHQGPILIQTHIYHSVFQRWGMKALEALINFWKDWPDLAPSQRLLIFVCVYYQPSPRQAFLDRLFKHDPRADLARFIAKTAGEPTGPSHWVGLPPLEGANLQDATNWARRKEVSERFESESIVAELQEFFLERTSQPKAPQLIPLGILAKRLKEIVPKYLRA